MNQPAAAQGLGARISSFGHALRGIGVLLRSQVNARIHLVATIIVVVAGVALDLSATDWGLVTLAMVAVWVAEGFNTAIEFLVDLVSPEVRPLAGKIKDVAAGAVLIAAVGAAVVGLLVFVPPVLRLVGN